MERLKRELKERSVNGIYLFYGDEEYLKTLYRNRIRESLDLDVNDMNYSRYEGKKVTPEEAVSMFQVVPFMAPKRLVVLENTGLFQAQFDRFYEALKNRPDFLVVLMIENAVDKRRVAYKRIAEIAKVVEFRAGDQDQMETMVRFQLKNDSMQMEPKAMRYLLENSQPDLLSVRNNTEKVILYAKGRTTVTEEDVRAVLEPVIENRIHDMVQAVSEHRPDEVIRLYQGLLYHKEKPDSILARLKWEYNFLLQICEAGEGAATVAQTLGVKRFMVQKRLPIARKTGFVKLKEAFTKCSELEYRIRSGKIPKQLGLEMLLLDLCR